MSLASSASPVANQYVNLLRTDQSSLLVTANTNIFATDWAVATRVGVVAPLTAPPVVAFVIYVTPQAAGTFSAFRTKSGVPTNKAETFNGGTNLSVNGAYGFAMLVGQNDTINFQYSVNTTFTEFMLVEVP